MNPEEVSAKIFQEIPVGMVLFDSDLRRVATLWYNEVQADPRILLPPVRYLRRLPDS